MTRLPTRIGLQALIDSVRALNQKPRNRALPDPTLLAAIERRILRAYTRDTTGSTDRDGYPTSTLGGYGTNGNGSSTETHALGRPERDRHHELTTLAISHLEQIVISGNALVSSLDALDALTSDLGPTPRTCTACTGFRPQGGNQAVTHRTTVGNRLKRDVDLCDCCFEFVRQTAPPNSYDGRLPEPHEIAYHDQRGRWRLRVTELRSSQL